MIDERLRPIAENQPYPLLFATVSGAHLYGFPSADSDWDVRGVHILPVEEVVGLLVGEETVQTSRMEDGLDLDLVTHDVLKFARLMLNRNGYVLEQLFSPLVILTSDGHSSSLSWVGLASPATTSITISVSSTINGSSFKRRTRLASSLCCTPSEFCSRAYT